MTVTYNDYDHKIKVNSIVIMIMSIRSYIKVTTIMIVTYNDYDHKIKVTTIVIMTFIL